MAGSVRRRRNVGKAYGAGACVSVDEILSDTPEREGLENSLPFFSVGRNLNRRAVKVRLGLRAVSYHVSGCIPEHERDERVTEAVVVECPGDTEDRCKGCILNAGEEAVRVYESVVIREGDEKNSLLSSGY